MFSESKAILKAKGGGGRFQEVIAADFRIREKQD
jgi:hypothetical protein